VNANKLIFILGSAGVGLFVFSTICAGYLIPEYSHYKQLISESYAIDTNYGLPLRYFGFLPSGLLIFLFALGAKSALPQSTITTIGLFGVGLFYGLGTVVVSVFPCDQGCNPELIDPSISQLIHNSVGLLTYLLVPLCLIFIGIASQKWKNGRILSIVSFILGSSSILLVGVFSSHLQSDFAGLLQRLIEGSILIWILFLSKYIKSQIR
jgi:hypothetical protein